MPACLLHVTESKRGVLLGLLPALGRHPGGSRMRGVCTLLHIPESNWGCSSRASASPGVTPRWEQDARRVHPASRYRKQMGVFFSGFCQPWGDTPVGGG